MPDTSFHHILQIFFHPISKSLQRACGRELDRSRVTDIQEISGHGVTAQVDGIPVAAGNDKLMRRLGLEPIPCHSVGTIIHLAVDGTYAGHIVISDTVKEHSREAIRKLKAAGVKQTVMLTGDARQVAEAVAAELGVDQVYSELLPADKVTKVEELLEHKAPKEKLAFVGDGINDAPVLSRADIGIAMGAMGSDAAIEAADVVLMDDDPLKIAKAIGSPACASASSIRTSPLPCWSSSPAWPWGPWASPICGWPSLPMWV